MSQQLELLGDASEGYCKTRNLHLLKSLGFLSIANRNYSLADLIQRENPNHPKLSSKYDIGKVIATALQNDQMAEIALDDACFYCPKEAKEECFIATLPKESKFTSFEVWFRHSEDRKQFEKELVIDPKTVCFPYHKNPNIDK